MQKSSTIRNLRSFKKLGNLMVKSACLSSTLMMAATLPVFAGPDFGNMRMGGGGIDIARMSIVRDSKPNIPIQIQAINPDSIGRVVIRADGPRIMPILPVMIPSPDIVRNPVVMPITPTFMPDISNQVKRIFSPKDISIRPTLAQPTIPILQLAAPDTAALSSDVNTSIILDQERGASERKGNGNRSGNVQFAAFTPQATNQTSSSFTSGQTNPGGANENNDLAEIQAQTFVGRSLGTVVNSDFVNDPVDVEGIKKAVSDRITLFDGTTLFVPDHNMVVESRHGRVNLAAKSVVLVSASEEGLAVYDIHDDKKGSITVQSGERTFKLAPGRHVVITTDESGQFAMANALELIAHSDVQHISDESRHAYTSAFSIPGAINSVSALKSLAISKDPDLKKVSDKIMKTAAVLLIMGSPNYKHYLRPRVTLLSQN